MAEFVKTISPEVFQDCEEWERDHVKLSDGYDDANPYPDSMLVALLYITERYSVFSSLYEFEEFAGDFESEKVDLITFIRKWATKLDKNADSFNVLKFLTSSPKQVEGIPPYSTCPRCGLPLWQHTNRYTAESEEQYRERLAALITNESIPRYCHTCGQRFKFADRGCSDLAFKATIGPAGVCKLVRAYTQPQLTQLNA